MDFLSKEGGRCCSILASDKNEKDRKNLRHETNKTDRNPPITNHNSLAPKPVRAIRVTRGGLVPSATSEIAVDDWERGWNHKSWLSELAQVNTCFLRGMLRWLTEQENPKYAKRTARYNEFRYKYLDKLSIHLVRESVHLTVSLGISKTIPCLNKLMQIENWETDHVQYSLYVDISYKFTLACVFVSHACRQITVNTFINDLYSLQG